MGTAPDPATKAAITTAYKSFFNSNTSQAESEAALQHGATFHETLAKEAAGSNAQNSSVTVGKITVSGDVGTVTFSILQSGASLLSNAEGFAVRENGTWKVAAQTFCSLLNLEQTAPPACKDPAITALPH